MTKKRGHDDEDDDDDDDELYHDYDDDDDLNEKQVWMELARVGSTMIICLRCLSIDKFL